MKTHLECLPCFCRQALEAVRFVTDDIEVQERTLRLVLEKASKMDLRVTPPEMGSYIHHLIREITGSADPYRRIKERFNEAALGLYPALEEKVRQAPDPLEAAVRLAIAGNVIDFAVTTELTESHVEEVIEKAMTAPLVGSGMPTFRRVVQEAGQILYLADNAGEIVFDRLLVEQLPRERVAFAVKARPIINDATLEDARVAGLTEIVEVIDNGADDPGTILSNCSDEFRRRFEEADLVISKGQGNYETLSEAPGNVFFLLMAKCPVIAGDIGCRVGDLVLSNGKLGESITASEDVAAASR